MSCNCYNNNCTECNEPKSAQCYGTWCDDKLSGLDKVTHVNLIATEYPTGKCFTRLADGEQGYVATDGNGGFKTYKKICEDIFTINESKQYLVDGMGNIQLDIDSNPIRINPPSWDYILGLNTDGCAIKLRGSSNVDGTLLWDKGLGQWKVGGIYDNGIMTTQEFSTSARLQITGIECPSECECNPNEPKELETLKFEASDVVMLDSDGCAKAVGCDNPSSGVPDTLVGCKDGNIRHFNLDTVQPEIPEAVTLCDLIPSNSSLRFIQPVYNRPVLLNEQSVQDNSSGTFSLNNLTIPDCADGIKLEAYVSAHSKSTGDPANILVELGETANTVRFALRVIAEEQRDDVSSVASAAGHNQIWLDIDQMSNNNVHYKCTYNDYNGDVVADDIEYTIRVYAIEWAVHPCCPEE